MAKFYFRAQDLKGQRRSGTQEAATAAEVATRLRASGLFVLEVSRSGPGRVLASLRPGRYTSPGAQDRVMLCRQLALMLRSGNTLSQGLQICAEMTEKRALQYSLINMLIRIQGGSSFAQAIEAQKRMFPPIVAKLIASAEQSGEMQQTLERLADNLERTAAVRRQFLSSMTYPTILLLAAFGVFMGLALGIVPKFAKMLEGRSQQLPGMTKAMLDISAWLVDYGMYLGIGLGGSILGVLIAYTTPPGKAAIDRVLLYLPVLGTSIRTSAMAQMGWTTSMLLGSGLTIMEALRILASIIDNRRLAQCFEEAGNIILSGHSLATGLQQPQIPVLVQHMAGIGERSGELEHVMLELGKFYQHQAELRIKRMVAMIEPAMTLVVGGMVAFVYIGFFKAMMQVSAG